MAKHDKDAWEADENGNVLVLAACMQHYATQHVSDLKRGRWADCTNPKCGVR